MRRRWPGLVSAAMLVLAAGSGGAAAAAQGPAALTVESVQVVYWPGHEGLARRTMQAATSQMLFPGIGRLQGLAAGTIVLAPTPAAFDSVTGGRAPHWSAGVAIPSQRLIVLPAFSSPRTAGQDALVALRHELAHLVLHDHLQSEIPRWFNEGYATWASGEFDASAGWQIRLALLRGVLPPLDSLTLSWPEGAAHARLAYLLAASAVQYLATRGSDQAFSAFLDTWRSEGSMQVALRTVYLTTVERFESDWRDMIRRRYGWLLAVAQIGFFWILVTFLLLSMGVLRRRRNREKLEGMRAEDRARLAEQGAEHSERESEWWAEVPEGIPARELDPSDESPDGPVAADPSGAPRVDEERRHG
jgi:hypothetical protein